MRTRTASIATIVIALGLALTSVGLARSLPYTVGGAGSPSSVGADLWAHGSAVSPALVALVVAGILAVIGMRPTRGGRRAAGALTVLATVVAFAGVAEPAQRDALVFAANDVVLSALVLAFHGGLVALVLSALVDAHVTHDPLEREATGDAAAERGLELVATMAPAG